MEKNEKAVSIQLSAFSRKAKPQFLLTTEN